MKKLVMLLLLSTFLITGCSITTLSNSDIDNNINKLLNDNVKLKNVQYDGYSYYVPRGLKIYVRDDYNVIFKDEYGNSYFMYIDIIGYYNKVDIKNDKNNGYYYYKELNYNNKKGYVKIDELGDKYLIKYYYNYAKLEAYVYKKHLVNTINNMSFIIRSVSYNDKIINSLIGKDVYNKKDENYVLFKDKTTVEDFLEIVDKYDSNYKKHRDDEAIQLDE